MPWLKYTKKLEEVTDPKTPPTHVCALPMEPVTEIHPDAIAYAPDPGRRPDGNKGDIWECEVTSCMKVYKVVDTAYGLRWMEGGFFMGYWYRRQAQRWRDKTLPNY